MLRNVSVPLEATSRGARFIPKIIRINNHNNNKLRLTFRKERGMGVSENGVVSRTRIWMQDERSMRRMELYVELQNKPSSPFVSNKCV